MFWFFSIPHSFQPSFFPKAGSVSLGFKGGFSRTIRIPGKNGNGRYPYRVPQDAQLPKANRPFNLLVSLGPFLVELPKGDHLLFPTPLGKDYARPDHLQLHHELLREGRTLAHSPALLRPDAPEASPKKSRADEKMGCVGQNRFGFDPMLGVGQFTAHFRTYFSGGWDVHWGLTHGQYVLSYSRLVVISIIMSLCFCFCFFFFLCVVLFLCCFCFCFCTGNLFLSNPGL